LPSLGVHGSHAAGPWLFYGGAVVIAFRFVVWQDERHSGSNFTYYDVYGARVSTAGELLDPDGIALTTDQHEDYYPDVASDGTDCLVVFRDHAAGPADMLVAVRVAADGTILDPTPLVLVTGAESSNYAVTFGGGQYFVVWSTSDQELRAARVTPDGTLLDADPGILLRPAATQPDVVYDGTQFVVTFRECTSTCQIFAMRVSVDGAVVDGQGLSLSDYLPMTSASSYGRWSAVASFDGTDTFVTWASDHARKEICGAWFSPEGEVINSKVLLSSTTGCYHSPALASAGNGSDNLLTVVHGDLTPGYRAYRAEGSLLAAVNEGEPCEDGTDCKTGFCVDDVCCDTECSLSTSDCHACSVAAGAWSMHLQRTLRERLRGYRNLP